MCKGFFLSWEQYQQLLTATHLMLFSVLTCNEHSESDFDAFYSQSAGVRVSVTVIPITSLSLSWQLHGFIPPPCL